MELNRGRENVEEEMVTTLDRSEISRALAKVIAYKNCGKQRDAESWARRLVELLECEDILG